MEATYTGGFRRMLPLDSPRWHSYKGGYRVPYDASPALRRLLANGPDDNLWDELWTALHHQGDVPQASYAAVPWLVEYIRRSPKSVGTSPTPHRNRRYPRFLGV